MPITKLRGVRYSYLDEGSGPLVFFGHGLTCDKHMFDAQVASLCNRYRCVSIDWPGHAASGFRSEGFTLDDLADDTIALLDHLDADSAVLVGLSQGGMAFMRVAGTHPDRVRALVLLDTNARAEAADRADAILENARRLQTAPTEERRAFMREAAIPAFFGKPWRDAHPDLVEREVELRVRHDRNGYALAVQAVATRQEIRDVATRITAPTLILVGELDALTPIEDAEELHGLIPASRLVVVPDAGHHTPIEQPRLVTAAIEEFLAELVTADR